MAIDLEGIADGRGNVSVKSQRIVEMERSVEQSCLWVNEAVEVLVLLSA